MEGCGRESAAKTETKEKETTEGKASRRARRKDGGRDGERAREGRDELFSKEKLP